MPITGGSEFVVNSSPADAGGKVSVAGHDDGGFFIAWTSDSPQVIDENSNFDPRLDIYGRAFDDGAPLTSDFLVNTQQRDRQFDPQVAAYGENSYVVAYSSGEEDSLPGTYAASQILTNAGVKVGIEHFGDDSNYHWFTDVAVAPDGRYAIVSSEEFTAEVQLHAADGTILSETLFGYTGATTAVSATTIGANDFLVVWQGYENEAEAETDGIEGLFAQVRHFDGSAAGAPFLVGGALSEADPTIRLLDDGSVAFLYRQSGDYYLSIIDPLTGTASAPTAITASGLAANAELAVLDTGDIVVAWTDAGGDGSGTAIKARVFDENGVADGTAFQVNTVTVGSQVEPSVAGVGNGEFVVAWSGPDGVKARIFDTDAAPAPVSPLFTRPGTLDLSPSPNQVVAGVAGPNSVFVDIAAASGQDRVTNFSKSDVFLTTAKLSDGNGDGVINFGGNGVLDLDGAGGSADTVRFDGVKGLRYLGESEGLFVYADAAGRPKGAIEGKLGTETLKGDAAGAKAEVFFHDTGLGFGLGDDRIETFGASDIFVTTSKIADGNNDGIIGFGSDKLLNLGPDDIQFVGVGGNIVAVLEFDGAVGHGGATYYVYSLVGSAAGVANLTF